MRIQQILVFLVAISVVAQATYLSNSAYHKLSKDEIHSIMGRNFVKPRQQDRLIVASVVTVFEWTVPGEDTYDKVDLFWDRDPHDDDDYDASEELNHMGLSKVPYVSETDLFTWPPPPVGAVSIPFRASLLVYKRELVEDTCYNGDTFYTCNTAKNVPYWHHIQEILVQSEDITFEGTSYLFTDLNNPAIQINITLRCANCGEMEAPPMTRVGVRDVELQSIDNLSGYNPYVFCFDYEGEIDHTPILGNQIGMVDSNIGMVDDWIGSVKACGVYNYFPGLVDEYGWTAHVVSYDALRNGPVDVVGQNGRFTLYECDADNPCNDNIDPEFDPDHPGSSASHLEIACFAILSLLSVFIF